MSEKLNRRQLDFVLDLETFHLFRDASSVLSLHSAPLGKLNASEETRSFKQMVNEESEHNALWVELPQAPTFFTYINFNELRGGLKP